MAFAETAVSAHLKVICEKLASESLKKYARSQHIHSDLKDLERILYQIQAVLNDASHKEITDESVRLWLNSLQHLAYDIDAVLDDLVTEAIQRELTQKSGASTSTSKIRKLIPTCCTNFSLTHRLSPKLDGITTKLQKLYEEKAVLGLTVENERQKDGNRGNETSLPDGSGVIGREVEKEKLLNKLLGDDGSSKENFSIVPIVGMGGVGKTTLARILYHDTRVQDHFQLKSWVSVSDDFDIFKISKTIFQDVSKENKEFQNLNQLQMAIAREIKDKRFLVVLDDVWTENYDYFESLLRPFHSGAYGSRVIMTTRKQQLLKEIGFNCLDLLQSLSDEDALSLLALHALGVDNFDSHKTLKPQAEGIVKKCGGLPLALKAIGRLLSTKTEEEEEEEWNDVLNSEIWNLDSADEILPALRLSYHDLPADLKRLFSYCSLFPKGFLFDKEELILLWMAEGYLNPSDAPKSPESMGRECFETLLSRSFFQDAPNGESLFVMHDLTNDFATFVAEDFFFQFNNEREMAEEALAKYLHMSFIREEYVGYQKLQTFERAINLRTLLAVSAGVNKSWDTFYLSSKILVDLIPNLPFLRVLCLSRFEISEVPNSIGILKYLTYLNLSQTKIRELPDNVGNLYNLQTLILFGCTCLTMLPRSFLKLKLLRHFDIRDTPLLKNLPVGIGEIKDLHTLTKIIIEGDNGFSITELRGLNNLHGEISIQSLHNVQSPTDAHEAKLSLKRLTKLELNWGEGSQHGTLEKEVLKELEPNSDWLKKLSIDSYSGIEFPKWVGHPSFHRLVHVLIRNCKNCASLPQLGQLPSLKELFIDGMDQVKFIGSEFTGTNQLIVGAFPSLEILRFENMQGWEVWSANSEVFDAVFPCLRELQIKDCPKLIKVSVEELPSLEVLKIDRCDVCVLRRMVHIASSITKLEIMSIFGLTYEVWKGVVEYLGAVEEIRIYMCNEISYLWESEAEASKVLVNLKELYVYNCSDLISLGEKEEVEDNFVSNLLSSLRILDVWHCNNMERCCCPDSIESLCIGSCSSVTRVSFPTTTGGQKLKSLDLSLCNKQTEINNTTGMPMLEYLFIYHWTNLKSITQFNFIHLTHLELYDCPSVKSFPDLQLPNLTYLEIEGCKNMEAFGDLQLPNLTYLEIERCENLESFPDLQLSNLTMLKHVEICMCPMIDASFPRGLWPPNLCSLLIGGLKKPIYEWGYQNFPASLVDLRLFGDPHVRNFSQLSHLFPSSLTSLHLAVFYYLESLSTGLQHLTSLQHLNLYQFSKVNDLPETLLPSLLSLIIDECPNLEERCSGRGSHYWPLISHIPKIQINYSYF